jgi:hypothetical protein
MTRDRYDELYGFDDEPLYCKECGFTHLGKEWSGGRVGCEDCGDHPAIQCPCGETYDMIYNNLPDDFTPPKPTKQPR